VESAVGYEDAGNGAECQVKRGEEEEAAGSSGELHLALRVVRDKGDRGSLAGTVARKRCSSGAEAQSELGALTQA
jgi:hypothetical protein